MVQDAEANAEADKKAVELVQAKNVADAQIHDANKVLVENTALTDEQKASLQTAIADVEAAVKAEDVQAIQETVGKLAQLNAQLNQPVPEAEVQPGATQETTTADNVVDAEFTEVKKEKK